MNITEEKIDNLNSLVKISIKPEDYLQSVEKAIKAQAKKAKLPGFREGLVPASHIKKVYGKSILVDQVNTLLNDSIKQYITDSKLNILGQPLPHADTEKHNWDLSDEFEFKYEVGLAPSFELDFSDKDSIPYYTIKIDNETLESRIKNIRKSYGKMTNPEVSSENDVLYAELTQLSADGSVFDDAIRATNSVRIDLVSNDEVKKSLIGLKIGDVIEFDIQKAFDHDSFQVSKILKIDEVDAKDLTSNFQMTVKNVNRLDESDLNQEFFDKVFGEGIVTTEEQFREKITGELEAMMVQNSETKFQSDLVKYTIGKYEMQLPDEFLMRWLKVTNKDLSDEDLQKGYADFANNLRWTLVADKVVKENQIEIKYEDVFESAKIKLGAQLSMYSPQAITDETLSDYTVQFLQNQESASKSFDEVKTRKVFDYLKSVITLDSQDIEYNKFLLLD
ncbi:trigger factor [Arcticibacter eurypsychrophilus]|uniref:trigger factor n=1 Tax=Arcticibacter eurypsychrophilus TaxID=1434752 RepID=UPI00084D3540|nr:trigger factor [Arcticibacter eurypsychrophilus]